MDHIKIENTWESYLISKECECDSWLTPNPDSYCNPIKTNCNHYSVYEDRYFNSEKVRTYMSCGAKFFANNLYAVKYPNLIITMTIDTKNSQNRYLHIFDTIQNKIIFSSKNILSEENQELIKRLHKKDRYKSCTTQINEARFMYISTMMMENFMIIKFQSTYDNGVGRGYVIFNFMTQTYKSFMFCDLYIYNDRSVFVFVEKGEDGKITKTKIITKSDIDNNINNIMEIDFCKTIEGYGKDGIDMCCMCNSSIIIFKLKKIVADKYFSKYIYCDIKKQKNVYTSKNQFIGWRGNKFIEYDEELKRCNLISFISDDIQQIPVKNNTPKKIINCIRCLDKFEESDEETIPEHKNVCSLCIVKL